MGTKGSCFIRQLHFHVPPCCLIDHVVNWKRTVWEVLLELDHMLSMLAEWQKLHSNSKFTTTNMYIARSTT